MTGVTAKSLLIMIGAVMACTAPFVHMTFPKKSNEIIALEYKLEDGKISQPSFDEKIHVLKEEQKMFGFSSPRRFWYALGLPLTLFFFALLFLGIINMVMDKDIRKAIYFSSFILLFISVYHIVWVLWPGEDLPKNLYHLSIVLMSLTASVMANLLIRYRLNLQQRIEKLIHFISIDAYFKYVKQEDRPEYMKDSYDVYDDITK